MTDPTSGTTPRPSLVDDLYRRLNEPGPLVTITKAQAAWLLEMEATKDIRIELACDGLAVAIGDGFRLPDLSPSTEKGPQP